VTGSNTITIAIPSTAVNGSSFTRFRLSSAGNLQPTGPAADGEVEDYAVTITALAADTVATIPDPVNPSKKIVVMMGTSKADDLQLQLGPNGTLLCKHGCQMSIYSLAMISRVVMVGGAGNDSLKVPSNFLLPVEMYGGDGNDTLTGGAGSDLLDGGAGDDKIFGGGGNDTLLGGLGNDTLSGDTGDDLLLGGDGSDQLSGGAGRDVLIGGLKADRLFGQEGDDLLIGGSTAFDNDQAALAAIVGEWRSTSDDFAARIAKLSVVLTPASVIDDNAKDQLDGGAGRDWFLDFLLLDSINDFNPNPASGDRKN
jgi:hypothetical protein